MNDNIQVSKEFLAEEQKLCQTMPRSKKNGGRYPIHIRKDRRDEVFRLHFDYGYSARKIAEMIKVNRNTVNSDIMYCYSQLEKDDHHTSPDDWIKKSLYRLETKRARLMEKLDKTAVLSESITLEKMLYEIDNKIMQTAIKVQTSRETIYDFAMNKLNNWLEENNYKERYILWGQTMRVSSDTSKKVNKIIQSDRFQRTN